MPSFYQDVEAEVEIDVDEFLSKCTSSEIKELVKALIEDGWIKKQGAKIVSSLEENSTLSEKFFNTTIHKLQSSYLEMSQEDIDILNNIAKKY